MAIDSPAKRYSAMNVMCPWRTVGVLPTGTVTAAQRLGLRWLYTGIAATDSVIIDFYDDLNTRLYVYLKAYYAMSGTPDLTTMIDAYLAELTGDELKRFNRLIRDATDAMQ